MTRIFSGIQPRGAKHIGNYSGAWRLYAEMQERDDLFVCIVDLHSITVDYEPEALRSSRLDLVAALFAAGLDPERATVFADSDVSAHAQAAALLAPLAGYRQLRTMNQFKEDSAGRESVAAALLTWPVLMAADILLYQPEFVVSGTDNRQHLEFTRGIAKRFNSRFGTTFRLPKPLFPDEGARIMNLCEPRRKMSSWSGPAQGVLLIADEPDAIRAKVGAAATDADGTSNLLEILSVATGVPRTELAARYDGGAAGKLRDDVAEAVVTRLDPIRMRYEALRGDAPELERLLRRGAEKAREQERPTFAAMCERMGFVPVPA
ncbi:MAG: tryptophan--tRNA ligase [Actinomycetota bacterium]|nr:tryptophan--tRNA ligase [Actinomycetota bacterium]